MRHFFVRFWHKADFEYWLSNVGFWVNSGHRGFRPSCLLLTNSGHEVIDLPTYLLAFSNVIISLRVSVTHLVVTGGPPPAMCQAA
jgi:hypothetical protein